MVGVDPQLNRIKAAVMAVCKKYPALYRLNLDTIIHVKQSRSGDAEINISAPNIQETLTDLHAALTTNDIKDTSLTESQLTISLPLKNAAHNIHKVQNYLTARQNITKAFHAIENNCRGDKNLNDWRHLTITADAQNCVIVWDSNIWHPEPSTIPNTCRAIINLDSQQQVTAPLLKALKVLVAKDVQHETISTSYQCNKDHSYFQEVAKILNPVDYDSVVYFGTYTKITVTLPLATAATLLKQKKEQCVP